MSSGARTDSWTFGHEVSIHGFYVGDDGEVAAIVHWAWIQDYRLDEPAIVIYEREGAKRT